jgi:hypothetical protein
MSPLVSACLAAHLKKTVNNVIQYGYPVGALAMVAAVVCLSLVTYFIASESDLVRSWYGYGISLNGGST